jgi:HEAT repeat protein
MADYRQGAGSNSQEQVIYRLSGLKTEEALGALSTLFSQEQDDDLKETLLDAMSEITSSNTVAAIAPALDPKQATRVRLAAVDALSTVDSPASIPYLAPLRDDPDPEIRDQAQAAIESIRTPRITPEQLQQFKMRYQARKAAADLDKRKAAE